MPDVNAELSTRVDEVARRAGRSRKDVIRDALELGHSLSWQEEWTRRVYAGLAAAERGEFVEDTGAAIAGSYLPLARKISARRAAEWGLRSLT